MAAPLFDDLETIRRRVSLAPHVLVFLDYDGTLTPLVDHPSCAHLESRMREHLRSLTNSDKRTVAFLSGRALDDLQARVGLERVIYAGNHGLEIKCAGYQFIRSVPPSNLDCLRQIATKLSHLLRRVPGAFVEDKQLTLSVHFRLVPRGLIDDVGTIVSEVMQDMGDGFRVTSGSMVYEIRPNNDWNKGSAASWIRRAAGIEDNGLTICLGDDVTDEDAFAALPEGINVRVGKDNATKAGYYVNRPDDVRRFLQWLGTLDERTPRPSYSRSLSSR